MIYTGGLGACSSASVIKLLVCASADIKYSGKCQERVLDSAFFICKEICSLEKGKACLEDVHFHEGVEIPFSLLIRIIKTEKLVHKIKSETFFGAFIK